MPRPIWSGTISFGLVSVPVRMFSTTESKELRFQFLHKQNGSLNPIGYDKIDKERDRSDLFPQGLLPAARQGRREAVQAARRSA